MLISSTKHESSNRPISPNDTLQLAAVFDSQQKAQKTIELVHKSTSVMPSQIEIFHKNRNNFKSRLDGKRRPIGERLLSSHLLMGATGFIQGSVIAFLMSEYGPTVSQQHPLYTYIALVFPCIFIGSVIAGLIGLKPERDDIVCMLKYAVNQGNTALVINMRRSQSPKAVIDVLKQYAYQVVEAAY